MNIHHFGDFWAGFYKLNCRIRTQGVGIIKTLFICFYFVCHIARSLKFFYFKVQGQTNSYGKLSPFAPCKSRRLFDRPCMERAEYNTEVNSHDTHLLTYSLYLCFFSNMRVTIFKRIPYLSQLNNLENHITLSIIPPLISVWIASCTFENAFFLNFSTVYRVRVSYRCFDSYCNRS